MGQINEAKEKLPIDFIAQFISKGWDEVGYLKASIDGIKKEFSGTEKVEEILNNFMDSYLIAIGQMEEQAGKKIDMPAKEDLKEALFELEEPVKELEIQEPAKEVECCEKTEVFTELPDYEVEVEQKGDKIEIELEPKCVDGKCEEEPAEIQIVEPEVPAVKSNVEPFEFFTDFDEPEEDEEAAEKIKAWQSFRNN